MMSGGVRFGILNERADMLTDYTFFLLMKTQNVAATIAQLMHELHMDQTAALAFVDRAMSEKLGKVARD